MNWRDLQNSPQPLVNLMAYIKKNSPPPKPRFVFALNGIQLFYDKMWLTGSSQVDGHRLEGKDWFIHFRVCQSGFEWAGPNPVQIRMDGRTFDVLSMEINNQDGFERDLTLLRMFGAEELFSSN